MFEIREREVPEQLVLTEQRHVYVKELPHWLPAAMQRLTTSAQGYGGVAGAPFVPCGDGRRESRSAVVLADKYAWASNAAQSRPAR